jgi:purine-binding chemotaxis protein CheW
MSDSSTIGGQDVARPPRTAHPGKYLTFTLSEEIYGLEILKVQEIIGLMKVTHIPKTPSFIRGVINLRGKVIPVVELRVKFAMDSIPDDERTCIIVLRIARQGVPVTRGILVDSVSEVLDITADQIDDAPSFGASVETDFLLGIGKIVHKVVMLLDVDRVLSGEELAMVECAELLA